MNAMNKIYIDLSEEELEIVQNLLQDDAVDDLLDPNDIGEITAANENSQSTSWDAQNSTAVGDSVASNGNDDSDATYCSFVEDVVAENVDDQISDDEEQSGEDPTASNFLFTPPILCLSTSLLSAKNIERVIFYYPNHLNYNLNSTHI